MRSLERLLCCGVLALLSLTAAPVALRAADTAAASAGSADPAEIVRSVAVKFLADVAANRATYRDHPQELRALVDKEILPFFDVEYTARLVLGRHWRDASPEQRQHFVDAFESALLNNYGTAVADFNSDRMRVLPDKGPPASGPAIVRTEITRMDGSVASVEYVMHQTPQGWKAWDVIIEGISYVKSFRDDFGAQIDQQGIDSVITRLQNGASPKVPGAEHHGGNGG
jgi:phospholipid transport system substrate-binding protein